MASTPWGMAAEAAWRMADQLRQEVEKHPEYDMRCIFCKNKVFFEPDEISRIHGHIYSDSGRREFDLTGICEYCFDKTADSMDGVPNWYFTKLFPQDSMRVWQWLGPQNSTENSLAAEYIDEVIDIPDEFYDQFPEDGDYEWNR